MKRGLIHIYTGDGKGKTTAATGLAVRAAGFGLKVLFVQFFKEDSAPSGEKAFFRNYASETVTVLRSNCRHPFFTAGKTDKEAVATAIGKTFERVKKSVSAGGIDLLVLDEVISVIRGGWIPVDEFIDFIESRPPGLEVAMTGRDAPPELVRLADYVTEMLKIKHPFDEGINARKGVDF